MQADSALRGIPAIPIKNAGSWVGAEPAEAHHDV